jgi:hypothetical protein
MRTLCCFSLLTFACYGADLKDSLTFHATFDGTTDARVALGDKRLFVAQNYKDQGNAQPGLTGTGVELAPKDGRKGGGLRFIGKNTRAIFYKADKNIAFDGKGWTGTISFWLNLDPDKDLEPGFCDPIQITDKAYNDSAIWVDFTKDDKPRHFRLGVFGALKAWNPQNLPADKYPLFNDRLVVVKQTPFASGKWTHVAITHTALGSGKGTAQLYLNGKSQGTTPSIAGPFEWDLSKGAIRLGVNYVGLLDEVAIFKRALTANEIETLSQGKF